MQTLQLTAPAENDVVVQTEFSGISSGTERLLWSGEMPPFPGLSYPLVPGYETAGTVIDAPSDPSLVGAHVFVPGARCYKDAAGLFGGAADLLVVPRSRVFLSPCAAARETTLLALAATAYRIVFRGRNVPELVIGNGALGRLVARITEAVSGQRPVVWEKNPGRRTDQASDTAICPSSDTRTDYSTICDVSGDAAIIDACVHHAARDAEFVLGGFYAGAVSFEFAPAFIKELRVSISSEWQPTDLTTSWRSSPNAGSRSTVSSLMSPPPQKPSAHTIRRSPIRAV